eukprot:TRINITY_DN108704_c0_g1_i1.p1 TRINITY_DN108704_c0_g1~~TRINITY_DN108704_c0_g1_i1.p1  ORF type:complete len:436 (-),score=62.72 TRINITY_DN108704_c0_g1_i1:139-1446(-)
MISTSTLLLCLLLQYTAPVASVRTAVEAEIWNGTDIQVHDAEGMKVGPFPAFVALVYAHKWTPNAWQKCGGTLYKQKFIVTAAHCVTFDPSDWELHAYLNPYWNPLIPENDIHGARLREFMEATTWEENLSEILSSTTRSFKEDQHSGLGIWLEVALPAGNATNYGTYHEDYETVEVMAGFSFPRNDIAVVPLSRAPFAKDSKAWRVFETRVGVVEHGEAVAKAYGNGHVHPGDRGCSYMGTQNCKLQEKQLDVLRYEECVDHVLRLMAALRVDSPHASEDEKNDFTSTYFTHEIFQQVTGGKSISTGMYMDGSQSNSPDIGLDTSARERLLQYLEKINLELKDVRAGRQICVMASDRTGNVQEGDSGGPLVTQDGQLVGIASWAIGGTFGNNFIMQSFTEAPLLAYRMPSFYVNATYFEQWLSSHTNFGAAATE